MSKPRIACISAVIAAVSSSGAQAAATFEIPTALAIAKSANKNQVHYAVRVDDTCSPAGPSPVRPYWRMLERSKDAVESLSAMEASAFGVDRLTVDGSSVRFVLRGLPSRTITIQTMRAAEGACTSVASMPISGAQARVTDVYVKQSLFGVSYVQVEGVTASGEQVRERIKPG